MTQKDKLIKRLQAVPADFTFLEAESLLKQLGYMRSDKGHSSGSRVIFISEEHPPILMHKPHPRKELKAYQTKQLLDFLRQEGLI